MAVYIVRVKDPKKKRLFEQLMKELPFIETARTSVRYEKNMDMIAIMRGMDDIEAHERGEVRFRPLKELLKELDKEKERKKGASRNAARTTRKRGKPKGRP